MDDKVERSRGGDGITDISLDRSISGVMAVLTKKGSNGVGGANFRKEIWSICKSLPKGAFKRLHSLKTLVSMRSFGARKSYSKREGERGRHRDHFPKKLESRRGKIYRAEERVKA